MHGSLANYQKPLLLYWMMDAVNGTDEHTESTFTVSMVSNFSSESVGPPQNNAAYFLHTLTVLTVTCNLGIIVAFYKVPSLRVKASELLILSLSIVDFTQGLIFIPINNDYYIRQRWILGELGCQLWVAFGTYTGTTSLLLLVAISVDRVLLLTMTYPRYVRTLTRFRVKLVAAACAVIPVLPTITELGLWEYAKGIDPIARKINFDYTCLSTTRRLRGFQILLVVFNIIPCILVGIFSVFVMHRLRKILRRLQRVNPRVHGDSATAAAVMRFGTQRQFTRRGCNRGVHNLGVHNPEVRHPGNHRQRVRIRVLNHNRGHGIVRRAAQQNHRYFVKNRYVKPSITLCALVSAIMICVLPYTIYVTIISPLFNHNLNRTTILNLCLLMFCNPLFDALFYGLSNGKIRRFYSSQIRLIFMRICYR